MEVILFPDPVLVAISYLRQSLNDLSDSATVGRQVPAGRGRFVTIRLGGSDEPTSIVVQRSLLHVSAWDVNAQGAADLARLTRALLHAAAGTEQDGSLIYSVADADAVDNPDPLSGQSRETFAIHISMRGIPQ